MKHRPLHRYTGAEIDSAMADWHCQAGAADAQSEPPAAEIAGCGSHGEAPREIIKIAEGRHGGRRPGAGGAMPGAGRKPKPRPLVMPPPALAAGVRWYCLEAKPGQDARAMAHLSQQGFAVCYPRFIAAADGEPEPFFPGYGFVAFDVTADRWQPITSTRGVHRLFGVSPERPTALRPGTVERYIAAADGAGLVDVRPAAPAPDAPRRKWGGLEELAALCHRPGGERVAVLLGAVAAAVDRAAVRAARAGA